MLRIGISACLLGENVRYDGGHKLNPFLRDTLGQQVDHLDDPGSQESFTRALTVTGSPPPDRPR